MSYGIICRHGDCKAYASKKDPQNPKGFYCGNHAPQGSTQLRLSDHNGPEGMRSIEEQKKS